LSLALFLSFAFLMRLLVVQYWWPRFASGARGAKEASVRFPGGWCSSH